MINYSTDRIIIVCYPFWVGGKFLINSIGLSDHAVFPDINLIKQQMVGNFTPADKLGHLLEKLTNVTHSWNDLEFGFNTMFGITHKQLDSIPLYQKQNLSKFAYVIPTLIKESKPLDYIVNSNKYFLIETPNVDELNEHLKVWPNATVILFDRNFNKFKQWRRPDLSSESENWYSSSINTDKIFTWNADDYLDANTTIDKIEELYIKLGIPDFDQSNIQQYYQSWISKLEQLSHK
jgi:hypothetical protein